MTTIEKRRFFARSVTIRNQVSSRKEKDENWISFLQYKEISK